MKIDRLMGIVMILLKQDKITAPQLAKRFEVSVRTINRDIEDLCKAGIPLMTMQGYQGGIMIEKHYKIDKVLFTPNELQSILVGLQAMDTVSNKSYMTSFMEKLSLKDQPLFFDNTLILDLASYYQIPLTQKIELMKQAIRDKHLLRFDYYYEKGKTSRILEPYHLIFKWSSWYIFGYCHMKNDFRLFKLNRIENLTLQETTFQPRHIEPTLLDFNNYFNQANFHLVALFEDSSMYRLVEEYGADSFTKQADGKLHFERDFTNYSAMLQWILSFGSLVLPLAPQQLIDDVQMHAEKVIRQLS